MREEEIQVEAARRAMALSGITAAQRKIAQARIETELRAEVAARSAAEAERVAQAEADAERGRIASVVAEGEKVGKGRAALALALAGAIDATTARSLLSVLPPDAAATPGPLPAAQTYGTAAAQAERARITQILGHPEAEGREAVARRFAFQTRLTVDIFANAATSIAKVAAYDGPSIEARSRAAGDFGLSVGPVRSGAPSSQDVWAKAIKEVNAPFLGNEPEATEPSETDRSAALFAQVEAWRIEEGR